MREEEEEPTVPSERDATADDFLFHLYRGSELLQDNRVHEAKSELEQALSRKPADPKSQDLLAVVYFRLGMYPRAIAIYESLVRQHPDSVTPRVNLALCYVKTGQPTLARAELERVLETNPSHARAWGYLGLTHQRLGDLERARHAFLAGGHESMARRIEEMLGVAPPAAPDSERTALGLAARDAAAALDGDDALRADPGTAGDEGPISGRWAAHEPGREPATDRPPAGFASMPPVSTHDLALPPRPPGVPAAFVPSYAPSSLRPSMAPPSALPPTYSPASLGSHGPGSFAHPAWVPSGVPPAPRATEPDLAVPPSAVGLVQDALLVFPRDATTTLHPGGFVLMHAAEGLAARLDLVRSISCGAGWAADPLPRRSRGRAGGDEPLGGHATPLLSIQGRSELVLAPGAGQRLLPVAIDDGEPLTVRESALVALEVGVRYECGRMAVGDGEALAVVQLRGRGAAVLVGPPQLGSIEVEPGRTVLVRALSVLGWMGSLVPRLLLPSESPAGARGLVAFTGEGMVLVDVR